MIELFEPQTKKKHQASSPKDWFHIGSDMNACIRLKHECMSLARYSEIILGVETGLFQLKV